MQLLQILLQISTRVFRYYILLINVGSLSSGTAPAVFGYMDFFSIMFLSVRNIGSKNSGGVNLQIVEIWIKGPYL